MSKSIDWSKTYTPKVGNITGGLGSRNKHASMKESFKKSYEQLEEQEKAQEVMRKAMPLMKSLLLQRMVDKKPLTVMRPLPYTTEVLGGDEEEDDGFYQNVKKSENASFKSVTKQIPVGAVLTFVQLEKSMNQLWFRDQNGNEYGIYLEEQNRLLTQTDIYEAVAKQMNEEK